MKIGKVFERLQNNPRVESIVFGEKTALVTLAMGWHVEGATTIEAKTAHVARIFIEEAKQGPVTRVEIPTPTLAAEVEIPTPVANDNLIIVDSNWVSESLDNLDEDDDNAVMIAAQNAKVAMTPRNAALLVLANIMADAA